jgi:monofunctional biosynthetic peptidoglycan transglycosylase
MLRKLIVYTVLFVVMIVGVDILLCFVHPNISRLKKDNPVNTAFMEYRQKQWAQQGRKKQIIQNWVSLDRISPYLIKAVIIAEDDKFFSHDGFDFDAMQKAFEKDIKKGKFSSGGSTISQQLAKNLFLSPSKNPIRKIKEAILTLRLEHTLSKKRIMELYLNVAEWGDGIFGIQVAALHYFNTSASELGPKESARLASVLPNPVRFNANGDSQYIENRSAQIYRIMVQRGIVIPEYDELMNTSQTEAGDGNEDTPPAADAMPSDQPTAPSDTEIKNDTTNNSADEKIE